MNNNQITPQKDFAWSAIIGGIIAHFTIFLFLIFLSFNSDVFLLFLFIAIPAPISMGGLIAWCNNKLALFKKSNCLFFINMIAVPLAFLTSMNIPWIQIFLDWPDEFIGYRILILSVTYLVVGNAIVLFFGFMTFFGKKVFWHK